MTKRKTCPCGEKSIPGLIKSVALCQKHYNGLMFSDRSSNEHKEAVSMLRESQEIASHPPNQ